MNTKKDHFDVGRLGKSQSPPGLLELDRFNETQIIQCPSQKSFDSHLESWDEIRKIGKAQNCGIEWDVLEEKDKTFILRVNGPSKQDHQNALIEVMKFLCKEGIEPGLIIDTKDLNEHQNKLIKALDALESANG
jgi:CRISPR/Cas system CSM-associated protein Csm4 (group 5 of RAMP superfamily)